MVVRLRPVNAKEKKDGTLPVVSNSTADSVVTVVRGQGAKASRSAFKADKTFGSFSSQEEVFDETMPPILKDVMKGFESTVFAYGQTGTGKTHTMEGAIDSADERGIIPRSAERIFETLKGEEYTEHSVSVSYLEIYNQDLTDLLVPAAEAAPSGKGGQERAPAAKKNGGLRIVEGAGSTGVYCKGLKAQKVESVADVIQVLQSAQERRSIGETKMNKSSSRSHCIFTMTVESKEQTDGGFVMTRTGKLHLVDLAGSECAKSAGTENAKQERERKNINTSLLALGRVIVALKSGAKVPYRDSLLTRLLQESLGGCCKTCIIATVSPSILCVDQSMQTLKYAQQAHGIQNKPVMTSRMGKVNSGGAASMAALGGSSGGGGSDAALIESFQRLELKCAYMESEVEEAATALAKKHTQLQEMQERAEMAEGKIDAIQTQLDAALERAAEVERTHAQQLTTMQTEMASQASLLDQTTGALEEVQAALKSHAELEKGEKEGLQALAAQSAAMARGGLELMEKQREQINATIAAHDSGQLQDAHLATLEKTDAALESGVAGLSEQLRKHSEQLTESGGNLSAASGFAEELTDALNTGQATLQEAMSSQQASLQALCSGLEAAAGKLRQDNGAETHLATLAQAKDCVHGGVSGGADILASQAALSGEQDAAMQAMAEAQLAAQDMVMKQMMEGVQSLLQQNLQSLGGTFTSGLERVRSSHVAIGEQRAKAEAGLETMRSEFDGHVATAVETTRAWDVSNREVAGRADSLMQMGDAITGSVADAETSAQERTAANLGQVTQWAESNQAVAGAIASHASEATSAQGNVATLLSTVQQSIVGAKAETKAWADNGASVSTHLQGAVDAAQACTGKLTENAAQLASAFDAGLEAVDTQQGVSSTARAAGDSTAARGQECGAHLQSVQKEVAKQLEAANAAVAANGGSSAGAGSESVAEAPTCTESGEATTTAAENPFVPAKTATKQSRGRAKKAAGDAVTKNRKFGQQISNTLR